MTSNLSMLLLSSLCISSYACGGSASSSSPDASPANPDSGIDGGGAGADASTPDAGTPDAIPNSLPTISSVTDQSTQNAAIGPLAFTVDDAETAATDLIVTATSSDELIVPNANITLDGVGANRSIAVTPIASGAATITITVDDGGATATEDFLVTVTNNAPVTVADVYSAFGNTQLTVALDTGVLANDNDSDGGDSVVAIADSITTDLGGTVTLTADGAFSYLPPVGVTAATDSFNYEASDGFERTTGVATVALTELVWYVDNSAEVDGNGQSITPFDTLAEAETASGANHIIFVYSGTGDSTGMDVGISLAEGQQLLGEGVGLALATTTLVAAGTDPVITNTAGSGACVRLGGVGTVRGLTIVDAVTDGINGDTVTDVRIEDVTILRSGAQGIDIGNASPAGTVAVLIRNNTIAGDLATFTGSPGIDVQVRGTNDGNLDAEIRGNEIQGMSDGILVRTGGTTGNGAAANVVSIRENIISDLAGDAIQPETDNTSLTNYSITDNLVLGVDAMGNAAPLRGIDFRVRNSAGAISGIVTGNDLLGMGRVGINIVSTGTTAATITLLVDNNTMVSGSLEGMLIAPDDATIILATVSNNTMTDNFLPSAFEFAAGTAHRMDLNLVNNEDNTGFLLERDNVGVLNLGGTLGVGNSFDDDNGNVAANGNTSGGNAPIVTFGTGTNQINIVNPTTIPTP